MKNFDQLDVGQPVIVRPAGHRTGKVVMRDRNTLLPRWWVRIDGSVYGPYGLRDLVHPDDPDRVAVTR